MAVPIIFNGEIIGYVILGQIKREKVFSLAQKYISGLPLDVEKLKNIYDQMPCLEEKNINGIKSIAEMLAKYVLLEGMLKPRVNTNMGKALEYINANLDKKLTAQGISAAINVSKSVLYRNFHEYFNSTVNSYINAQRIERSVELLLGSEMPVEEIARITGFASTSYYSKLFKKAKGITALRYRTRYKNARS